MTRDKNYRMEMPPEGAICDFCSSPDVHWSFPARDVVTQREFRATALTTTSVHSEMVRVEHGSRGGWAACNVCAALIKRGDRIRLTRRSARKIVQKQAALGVVMSVRQLEQMLRPVHDNFWANRQGEPIHHETRPREDPTR